MPLSVADLSRRASPSLRRWLSRRRVAVAGVLARVPPPAPPRRAPPRELSPAAANEQIARRWIARTAALQSALQSAARWSDVRLPPGFEAEEHRYGRSTSIAIYGPVETDLPRASASSPAPQFYWSGEDFPTPAAAYRSLTERIAVLSRFDSPRVVLAERRKGTLREAWTLPLQRE